MTPEERERRAKSLVDDPLLQESYDVLREDLMNRWNHSGSTCLLYTSDAADE